MTDAAHPTEPPFVDAKTDLPQLEGEDEGGDNKDGLDEHDGANPTLPTKRSIRKTSKGQDYHCSLAKAECTRLLNRLTRQEKLMDILMESVENKEKLEHEASEYDKTFTDLVGAYTRYIDLNDSEEEKAAARKSLAELDSSIFDFKERIYTWMSLIKEPSTHSSRSSATSKHSRSSKSSKGSKHSLRSTHSSPRKPKSNISHNSAGSSGSQRSHLDFKADAAGWKAELEVVKRKREAELKAEVLEYEQKIRKAEAMEKVYREREEIINDDRKKENEGTRKRARKDDEVEVNEVKESGKVRKREVKDDKKEKRVKRKSEGKLDETSSELQHRNTDIKVEERGSQNFERSLVEVLQLQSAPKVDVDIFSGEILEYQYFIETFKEVVERVIHDERGRLTRLIQSTSGEAKELIKHCIHESRDTCYSHAMSLYLNSTSGILIVSQAHISKNFGVGLKSKQMTQVDSAPSIDSLSSVTFTRTNPISEN